MLVGTGGLRRWLAVESQLEAGACISGGTIRVLTAVMFLVIALFLVQAVRYLWLIGILALIGGLVLNYEKAATLINFLAFMGVNLAVIREFFFRPPASHARNWLLDLVIPGVAFVFCLWIWTSLPTPAKMIGGAWCVLGLIYTAIKTRGFRAAPVGMDLSGA